MITPRSKQREETPHCQKNGGVGSSNMAGIICPPGLNRVNWYPKTWGGTCPPISGVSEIVIKYFVSKKVLNDRKIHLPRNSSLNLIRLLIPWNVVTINKPKATKKYFFYTFLTWRISNTFSSSRSTFNIGQYSIF